MIGKKIRALHDFAHWVRAHTGKAVSVDINTWIYRHTDEPQTEYAIWAQGLIHEQSTDIDELLGMIPQLKLLCHKNKEVLL
jgi:hypothetical protein